MNTNKDHNQDQKHFFPWPEIKRESKETGGESVFVSSTCFDLVDLRNELSSAMTDWGLRPMLSDVGASYFQTYTVESLTSCLMNVDRADVFVMILSQHYNGKTLQELFLAKEGKILNGCLSATNVELCRALDIRKKNPSRGELPVIICVREELKNAYDVWNKGCKNEPYITKLKQCCQTSCDTKCEFSELLLDLYSSLHKSKTEPKGENTYFPDKDELIKNSFNLITQKDKNWLGLFEKDPDETVISKKTLNEKRFQVLAQFFLLYILEHNIKSNQPPIRIIKFNAVTDLKDLKEELYNFLQPNIQRARFVQALTEGNIPAISIDIDSTLPSHLFLTIKNASQFPLFWFQKKLPLEVYQLKRSEYEDEKNFLIFQKQWKSIGESTGNKVQFESTSSTLLPGESVMARVSEVHREDLDPSSGLRYFFQTNYRTTNNLYVADIFSIEFDKDAKRPYIRFVKKIPIYTNPKINNPKEPVES